MPRFPYTCESADEATSTAPRGEALCLVKEEADEYAPKVPGAGSGQHVLGTPVFVSSERAGERARARSI